MKLNRRQLTAGVTAVILGAINGYLMAKGQKPPPALNQAFIAAVGVLFAPKIEEGPENEEA